MDLGWRKSSFSSNTGQCLEAASWRKSSFSQGASNCVEAGTFRKSSHSVHVADACVEAGTGPGVVGVRDTKDKGLGPVLEFSPGAWSAFLAGIR